MVVFEHRSASYVWYVSIGAQKNAICSRSWQISFRLLELERKVGLKSIVLCSAAKLAIIGQAKRRAMRDLEGSRPASTTKASWSIGTPDIVKASLPVNARRDCGVTSSNAWRQPSMPRAVADMLPIVKSVDARRPSVVKVVSVVSLDADSAAAPPDWRRSRSGNSRKRDWRKVRTRRGWYRCGSQVHRIPVPSRLVVGAEILGKAREITERSVSILLHV